MNKTESNENGVILRGDEYWLDYRVNGRRERKKIGPQKKLAEDIMRKIRVEITEGKYLDRKKQEKMTFKAFAEIYIESYAKKKRSWETTDVHYLKRLMPYFGDKYLSEITPLMVERYQIERRKQKSYKGTLMSVALVNRELACLKCMFSLAVKEDYVSGNPVKKVKLEKENNMRVRFLEKDELEKLYDCSDEKFRPALMLAVNTGMRYSEMQYLKWENVDFQRGMITLRDTKNGETRQVPMNRTVHDILSVLPHNNAEAYVFCKKDGNPYNFRSPFLRARKNAGIKNFRFHDLRHTAASYLVMKGVDLNTVREILGHKTLEMTLRYSHLSPEHKTRAVNVLDEQMDTFWTNRCKAVKSPEEVYVYKSFALN